MSVIKDYTRICINICLIIISLIAICLCTSGCMSKADTELNDTTQTPSIMPTRTPRSTRTPTPTRPPRTPTPTPPTPTPLARLTPGTQLDHEERLQFFADLFATNGNCEFPCWWGITPGETTWDELRAFFNERGISIQTQRKARSLYALIDSSLFSADWGYGGVAFWGQDGIVQIIQVRGIISNPPTIHNIISSSPNQYLTQFDLVSALSMYGIPSQIYVSGTGTHSHSGMFGWYSLLLEYADSGISLSYGGNTIGNYTQYMICPWDGGVESITLQLQAKGSTFADSRAIMGIDPYELPWHKLEDRWGQMSPQAFHTSFLQHEPLVCLRIQEEAAQIIIPADFSPVLLTNEDRQLLAALTQNTDCELPCWLGITPGKTTVEEAQQIFLSYHKPIGIWKWSENTLYEVGHSYGHLSDPLDYIIRQSFLAKSDIVSHVHMGAAPPIWAAQHAKHLDQDWDRYTPASVMNRFGVPSQVEVFYDHPTCGKDYFLYINYEDLGIKVSYHGMVQRDAEKVIICPNTDNRLDLELSLTSPHNASGMGLRIPISSIDVNNFYQVYRYPNTTVCLELPEQTELTCP